MDVRIDRLKADEEKLLNLLQDNALIQLEEAIGSPPERYLLTYHVQGLAYNTKSRQVESRESFQVELTLGDAYPRLAPQCRMVSETYHPNIVADAICVIDYWSAGSSLSRLVVRIAELLAFQSYGLKYPLNPEAANWVQDHLDELPTDTTDFVAILHQAEGIRRASEDDIRPMDTCVGCGAVAAQTTLHITGSHHLVCENCQLPCTHCGVLMSEKSPHEHCQVCEEAACYTCIHRCLNCGVLVCFDHMTKCGICNLGHCPTCSRECSKCGTRTCAEHAGPAQRDGQEVILCESCLLAEA